MGTTKITVLLAARSFRLLYDTSCTHYLHLCVVFVWFIFILSHDEGCVRFDAFN